MKNLFSILSKRPNLEKAVIISHIFFIVIGLPILSLIDDYQVEQDDYILSGIFIFLSFLFLSYIYFLDQKKNFLSISIKWILIVTWVLGITTLIALIIIYFSDQFLWIIGPSIDELIGYVFLIIYILPSSIYLFFKITKIKAIIVFVFLAVASPLILIGYYSFNHLLLNMVAEGVLDENVIDEKEWETRTGGHDKFIPIALRNDYLRFISKISTNKEIDIVLKDSELLISKAIKSYGIHSKEEAFIKIAIGFQFQDILEYKSSHNYMNSGIRILEKLISQNKFSNQKEKTDLYDWLAFGYYYHRVNSFNLLNYNIHIELSLKLIDLFEKNKISEKFYNEMHIQKISKNNYLVITMTGLSDAYFNFGQEKQGIKWAKQALLISQNQDVSLFVKNNALASEINSLHKQGKIFEAIKSQEDLMVNYKKLYNNVKTGEMLTIDEQDYVEYAYGISMNNLALKYLESGIKFDEIENLLLKSINLISNDNPNDIMLHYPYYNLGNYYSAINNGKKSKKFFLKSIEIIELNISKEDPSLLILPVLALTQRYLYENNFTEASNLIERAENIFTNNKSINRISHLALMRTKADIYYVSGQYNKAIDILEPLIESSKTDSEILNIKSTLLKNYYYTREFDFVVSKALEIEQLIYKQPIKTMDSLSYLQQVANYYGYLEDLDPDNSFFSSKRKYQRSKKILHDIITFIPDNIDQNNISFAFVYHDLALLNFLAENYSEAIEWGGKMKKILTMQLLNGAKLKTLQADQLKEQKSFSEYFNVYTQILIDNVKRETEFNKITKEQHLFFLNEILTNVQLSMSSETAITLSKMAEVGSSKNQQLSKLHKRLSINEIQIENLRNKIDENLSKKISELNNKINNEYRKRVTVLEKENKEIRNEIYFKNPNLSQFSFMEPVQYEEIKKILKDDEAIIIFNKTNLSDFALYITKEDLFLKKIELSSKDFAKIRQNIDDFRKNINFYNTSNHFPVEQAYSLYKKLFNTENSNNPILKDKKHLIIIPSKDLINFPFWTLVTKKPPKINNSKDYKDVDWIANKYALSILPSLHNFKILRSQKKEKIKKATFVAFGDPLVGDKNEDTEKQVVQSLDLNEFFTREGRVDINEIKKLPRLKETEFELSKIAEYLNADENSLYLQGRATEQNIKDLNLSTTDILMFATHALVAGEINSINEPGIVLTPPKIANNENDGLLTSSEIMNLNLNAEWVILSACNTSSGNQTGAEPLSGLARAFFFAGAKSLLVSNWPVESQSAVKITTQMFDYLIKEDNISKSEALRRSIVALIKEEGRDFANHPMFWAPFILVGDGI